MEREYNTREVRSVTGASLRQLQWWDERGVVSPTQRGHRRLYTSVEVLKVSLIMGLREKGISLRKVRQILDQLRSDDGQSFFNMHRKGARVLMLTDGESVHVETAADRIVEILVRSELPIHVLCISDYIERLEPERARMEPGAQRKPVRSELSGGSRPVRPRAAKAS